MLSHSASMKPSGLLLTSTLVKVQSDNDIELLVQALIDPCSLVSIISSSLCQRLKLKVEKVNIPIRGTGNVLLSTLTTSAKFCIKPRFDSDFACTVDGFVLPKVTTYAPPTMDSSLHKPHLEALTLADPQCMKKGQIELLLDVDVYLRIVERAIKKGGRGRIKRTDSC